MSDVERAVQDLAAAMTYADRVKVAKFAEYRAMVNAAAVLAVLAILVALASSLV